MSRLRNSALLLLLACACIAQSFSVSGNAVLTGNVRIAPAQAPGEGEETPIPGVTITQLTDASVEGAPSACATAYYDTKAYSAAREQIFMGCGEQLTVSAFDWKPWTMNLDGTNKTQLSTKRILDPWGWTPDGTKIYFRSNGLAIMDPDTGTWATKIPGVVSGNLIQIGSNLFAIYENPSVPNTIGVWVSTDGGNSFSVHASYVLDDPYPTLSFHRLRASGVDLDEDGDPDLYHYKKSSGNGSGSFAFNANTGVSTAYSQDGTTVGEVGHPDIMASAATVYGHWLTACLSDPDCGYIYPFNLQTGVAGTALNLPQWSGWTYRARCCDESVNQLAMSKSVDPELALYDIGTASVLFDLVWPHPNTAAVTYWDEVAPQMIGANLILLRGPDSAGMPQIFTVEYVAP